MEQQETEGAEPRLGLMCFLDDTRECNGSCAAYLTNPAGYGPELNEQQGHCVFVTGVERLSRHMTIVANLLADSEKKKRIAEADRQREKALQPSSLNPFPRSPGKTGGT